MDLFINDFKAILPEFFLLLITNLLLIYGVIYASSTTKFYPVLMKNMIWFGILTLLATLLLLINNPFHHAVFFYDTLIIDDLSLFLKGLVLVGAISTLFMSLEYVKQERINSFEHVILILLACSGMLLMLSSHDLISMFLSIELQSLSFYVLATSKRNCEFSTESGLKYFILGAFSSGILLFGCTIVYGFTGMTNFEELAKLLTNIDYVGLELGILFLMVGFLFKVSAVPFHAWSPDTYEGAPTWITAFFSIVPKLALFGLFTRLFLSSFYDLTLEWSWIVIFASIASMSFSCFVAMSQKKVKRLLAFSSIGHVGFLLMAIACANIEGVQSMLVYLFIYMLMSINVFASVLSLRYNLYIADLHRLADQNPLLAFNLAMLFFSMAGVPPLAGFISKFYVFFAALSSSLYTLALVGVIASVFSSYYYIRLIKIMYFEKKKPFVVCYKPMDREKSLLIGLSLIIILLLFCYPTPLFILTHFVSLSLFN